MVLKLFKIIFIIIVFFFSPGSWTILKVKIEVDNYNHDNVYDFLIILNEKLYFT